MTNQPPQEIAIEGNVGRGGQRRGNLRLWCVRRSPERGFPYVADHTVVGVSCRAVPAPFHGAVVPDPLCDLAWLEHVPGPAHALTRLPLFRLPLWSPRFLRASRPRFGVQLL